MNYNTCIVSTADLDLIPPIIIYRVDFVGCNISHDLLYYSPKYCAGDKIYKNEMGWACGTYG